MSKIVIAIDMSDGFDKLTERTKSILDELQVELFKNGYSWAKSGQKVQTFYSAQNRYIVIIDKEMYTMSKNSLEYLSKESDIKYNDTIIKDGYTITSYLRYLKLKKLNII